MVENVHNYGGRWTEEKLDRVSAYLKAYLNVLKNQEFTRFYIDAFAGTPYYEPGEARKAADYADNLPGMQEPESVGLRRGSVKRALDIEPGFDRHIFIEKNARFAEELSMLRDQFQQKDISIRGETVMLRSNDSVKMTGSKKGIEGFCFSIRMVCRSNGAR